MWLLGIELTSFSANLCCRHIRLFVLTLFKFFFQATQYQRAAALIKMILNKDNCAYISFYNALLHEGYKDLAALLQSGLPLVSSSSGKDTDGGITSFGLYP
jgi:hypothetical protein